MAMVVVNSVACQSRRRIVILATFLAPFLSSPLTTAAMFAPAGIC